MTTVRAAAPARALRGPPIGAAIAWAFLVAVGSQGIPAADADPTTRFRGRPLAEVLEELQHRGLRLIYSSEVVRPDLVVATEPKAGDLRTTLDRLLVPFGLEAKDGAQGVILIVRAETPRPSPETPVDGARLVESIVVTPAHRKVVPEELGAVRSLSGDDVIAAPTFASDPSRAVSLLPGIAAADASAAFYARGSQAKDVSVVLDGLELYDPFHLSAFQSPFSFVDGRIVDAVDFVDGGFTADRGDRHGGFLEIQSASPAEIASGEIALGTLNSSVGYAAPTKAGKLLVSARYWYPEAVGDTITFGPDGLRPKLGDLYAKLEIVATPTTAVSGHLLLASDRASLVESDGNERLTASSGSAYLWFRVSRSWSPSVATDTVVSAGRIDRARRGVAEPDTGLVSLDDDRGVQFVGFRNDATWALGAKSVLRAGLDVEYLGADLSHAFGAPGAMSTVAVEPSGGSIGAYLSYRAQLGRRLVAEAGLRWDRQTYTDTRELSPRLNLMWAVGPRSELRLGAGRYAQSQRIHELRIEDGETAYGPPEISRQLDLAYLHRFSKPWSVRVDAYRHEMASLQPRYENLFHPIELFPEAEPDRVLVAPESATLQGLELSLSGDGGSPLTWWASYTWSRATDVLAGADVLRSWDQTHAGSFLAAYRWRSGWFGSLSGVVHTGWPMTPVTGREITLPDGSTEIEPVPGPRNSDRLPTYARLDLRAGRAFATAKGNVRVELTVQNVTDRNNARCVDETQFGVGADGRIEGTTTLDYWLGITPSIQMIWAF